ncbi:MAG: pilus assembly PilX N-terminal domain-containing protein [Rubrivivax sp.]|nr:pilus assembly PilX N-terminal domain-containing protein [Rubrivivax sp.]
MHPHPRTAALPAGAALRRGAASLVVVMILFFVITLVAAYTSRNLLFEQRTSANQYRATLAFEAADAGMEWAIARLNEGRMNNDCTELAPAAAVATPPQDSFRERYLDPNPATGAIGVRLQTTAPTVERRAGCVFNGTNWVCDCPADGNPAPTVTTTGNGPFPAFWVRFLSTQLGTPQRPGVIRIQVNACTRADASCLDFNRQAQSGDGLATVWSMVALRKGVPTAPAAALTVRGTLAFGGNTYTVTNADPVSGGTTIHGGGAVTPSVNTVLRTVPGSPGALSFVQNDPELALPNLAITPATPANNGDNRMFNSVFGTWPATYYAQPALSVVDCAANCAAADVNAVALRKPGHALRVNGPAGCRLRIDAPIGTAAAPVLLVSDCTVEFDSTAPTIYGLVYSRAALWELEGGSGTIRGAAVAERNFAFDNDNPSIIYDRDVMLRLQTFVGSYARIAGSWRDFQPGVNP